MAKTLVVFYSLEGNIAFFAKQIAEKLGADIFRIETVKEYPKKGLLKFLHGGKDSVSGFKPELKSQIPELSEYEKIVIGTPVWASKPAAPLNSFFEKADLSGKKCFTFASSAGGNASKCLELMSGAIDKSGGTVLASESFTNPLNKLDESLLKLESFKEKIAN